jgi:hypothetical protein
MKEEVDRFENLKKGDKVVVISEAVKVGVFDEPPKIVKVNDIKQEYWEYPKKEWKWEIKTSDGSRFRFNGTEIGRGLSIVRRELRSLDELEQSIIEWKEQKLLYEKRKMKELETKIKAIPIGNIIILGEPLINKKGEFTGEFKFWVRDNPKIFAKQIGIWNTIGSLVAQNPKIFNISILY